MTELALVAAIAAGLEAAAIVYLARLVAASSRRHQLTVDRLLERETGLLDRIADLAGRPWTLSPAAIEELPPPPPEPDPPREPYVTTPIGPLENE